jgi:hypothetical protein
MSNLSETREYKALQKSLNEDLGFEPWLKACLEDIEETLRDPEEPELNIDIMFEVMCKFLREKPFADKN